MPSSTRCVKMQCSIPPELDICSEKFDPVKALKCKNIPLPYPRARTYNNLAEYYSHTFAKKKCELESDRTLSKNHHYVLKRNYAWYYSTLGLDLPEDFDENSRYLKYTKKRRNGCGKYKVDKTAVVKEMPPEMLQPIRSEKIIVKRYDGTLKKYVIRGSDGNTPLEYEKNGSFNVCSSTNTVETELNNIPIEKSNTKMSAQEPLLGSEEMVTVRTAEQNSKEATRPSNTVYSTNEQRTNMNDKNAKNIGTSSKCTNMFQNEGLPSLEVSKKKYTVSSFNKDSHSLGLLTNLIQTVSPTSKLTACSSNMKDCNPKEVNETNRCSSSGNVKNKGQDVSLLNLHKIANNCSNIEENNSLKMMELMKDNRRCSNSGNVEHKPLDMSFISQRSSRNPKIAAADVKMACDKRKSHSKGTTAVKRKLEVSLNSENKKAKTKMQLVNCINNDPIQFNGLTNDCGNLMKQLDETSNSRIAEKHSSRHRSEDAKEGKSISHSEANTVRERIKPVSTDVFRKQGQEIHFRSFQMEKTKHSGEIDKSLENLKSDSHISSIRNKNTSSNGHDSSNKETQLAKEHNSKWKNREDIPEKRSSTSHSKTETNIEHVSPSHKEKICKQSHEKDFELNKKEKKDMLSEKFVNGDHRAWENIHKIENILRKKSCSKKQIVSTEACDYNPTSKQSTERKGKLSNSRCSDKSSDFIRKDQHPLKNNGDRDNNRNKLTKSKISKNKSEECYKKHLLSYDKCKSLSENVKNVEDVDMPVNTNNSKPNSREYCSSGSKKQNIVPEKDLKNKKDKKHYSNSKESYSSDSNKQNTVQEEDLSNKQDKKHCSNTRESYSSGRGKQNTVVKEDLRNKQNSAVDYALPLDCLKYTSDMKNLPHDSDISIGATYEESKLEIIDSSFETGNEMSLIKRKEKQKNKRCLKEREKSTSDSKQLAVHAIKGDNINKINDCENSNGEEGCISVGYVGNCDAVCSDKENAQSSDSSNNNSNKLDPQKDISAVNKPKQKKHIIESRKILGLKNEKGNMRKPFYDDSDMLNPQTGLILDVDEPFNQVEQVIENKGVVDSKSKGKDEDTVVDTQPVKNACGDCNLIKEQPGDIQKCTETCKSPTLKEYTIMSNKITPNVEISDNRISSFKELCSDKFDKESALLELARKVREELRAKMTKKSTENVTEKIDAEVISDVTKNNTNYEPSTPNLITHKTNTEVTSDDLNRKVTSESIIPSSAISICDNIDSGKEDPDCESTALNTINNICDSSAEALKVPNISPSNKNASGKTQSPVNDHINLKLVNLVSKKEMSQAPEIPVLKDHNSHVSCSDILDKNRYKNMFSGFKIPKRKTPATKDYENRKFRKII